MSEDVPYTRELSISSERTLDTLDGIPSNQGSPVHSPGSKYTGSMQNINSRPGSSAPPHHGRPSSPAVEVEGYQHPPVQSRVSWQSPVEAAHRPDDRERHTSRFLYEDGPEEHPSPRRSHRHESKEMPKVVIGSDSSPVRKIDPCFDTVRTRCSEKLRKTFSPWLLFATVAGFEFLIRQLKRKGEDNPRRGSGDREEPRVERELSDAYIDSISRTPRYEFGRHNTYDELLSSMNPDDPFQGSYTPSGKQRNKTKPPKAKKHRHPKEEPMIIEGSETYPMETRRRSKKKKKHKGDDSKESTTTSTIEGRENYGYKKTPEVTKRQHSLEADKTSVGSNGTYTLGEKIRASLTNLAAPIHKKKPLTKVQSSMCDRRPKSRDELDQHALADYIRDHKLKQRECKKYVCNKKSPKNECYCGRSVEWHQMKFDIDIPRDLKNMEEKKDIWHYKTHTECLPADSFGEIQFQGFGQEVVKSPYLRLDPAAELEVVWDLLAEHWKLPIPKLLISVTGGAQRFDLNPRLKAVFKRGLINAATTTGAWIITGGTATGVMQFVGEAVRDNIITLGSSDRVIALGVATWGCVANREALDGEEDEGLFPATYSLEDVSEIKGKDVPLDHNHTHFILVDDGTEGKFGGEIEFRTRFENYVSEKVETGVAENQSVNVPVVMLVVEGGVNTMKTVWQAIQEKTPVLILNGSGRAADFLACGYILSKDKYNEDKSVFRPDFDEEMQTLARDLFKWRQSDNIEKKIAECTRQLKDILSKRRLVSIFNMNEAETKDIDRAILYALLKANKTNANAQLSLALAWNRCDIARDEIFTQDNREHWKNISLYDAMFTALVQDRTDFVQLFLENGVSLKKFLSIETLKNLYGNVLNEASDTMAQLLNNLMLYLKQSWAAYLCCKPTNLTTSDGDLLFTVGKLLVHLLGDENMNIYNDEKFVVDTKLPVLQWLPGRHQEHLTKRAMSKHMSEMSGGSTIRSESGRRFFKRKRMIYDFNNNAEKQLFFWAILTNRRVLGKMFWRSGTDQLGAALVACSLLKALASVADDDEELELSQDLLDHAEMYETMAVGVLSECYKVDKRLAHQLLVRRLEDYGRTTLFCLADTNNLMRFMGHTSCQTKLNLIWKGRMALYTQTWKILLSLALPVCIPTIKFTTNEGLMGLEGGDKLDEYDDIDDEGECEEKKEEVAIISNKVMPHSSEKSNQPEEEYFVRAKTRRQKKKRKKLYKVQMFSDLRTDSIGILSAIYFFYTAPVTVFIVNMISYIVYLGIFTFFVLTDLHPDKVSFYEYLTWGWTVTMALEEARQVVSNDKRSLWYKVRNWFGSMWNQFDLAMYCIFIVSVILRFTLDGDSFVYARVMYSITLGMYFMRFMQFFFVEKNVGPKVIMIRNMLRDLMFFLGIFIVFMLSFGVMYQANLYPNSVANWRLLKDVIYIPYWQMYGELFLENMEGQEPEGGCESNETIWRAAGGADRCPEKNSLIPFLAALYLILTNILLVNLLIAMFSYTFQNVQDRSEQVWRFYRFSLVYEFYDRPMFCPPLITLSHIYRTIQWVVWKTCKPKKYHNEFKLNLDEKDNNRLMLFVRAATENYLNISQKAEKEELGYKVTDTASRIEKVIEELDNIKETVKVSKSHQEERNLHGSLEGGAESLLSARKQPAAEIEALQDQVNELHEQVAKTNLQTSQMMQLIQMYMQQSQRESTARLEISEMGPQVNVDDRSDTSL